MPSDSDCIKAQKYRNTIQKKRNEDFLFGIPVTFY